MLSKAAVIQLILFYSQMFGLDPKIALTIAKMESNFKVNAVGSSGEIGVFQLLPTSYPEFEKEELKNPRTNIILGIATLKKIKDKCKHLNKNWVVCYNAGFAGAKRIKQPSKHPYALKFNKIMKSNIYTGM